MPERLSKEQYNTLNKKRGKYGSQKVQCDGHIFDSKQEYKHYLELKIRWALGEIYMLRVHPKFDIQINHKHFCTYTGDFDYLLVDKGYEKWPDDMQMKKFHTQYLQSTLFSGPVGPLTAFCFCTLHVDAGTSENPERDKGALLR